MTALVLGVDPGKTGALAWLDATTGELVHLEDMPDVTGSALGARVRDLIVNHRTAVAWVEDVGSMPGNAAARMFTFGRDHGAVLGALGAFDVPVRMVRPHIWKKGLGRDKAAARDRAGREFPGWSSWFARAKDDGRAEAALIALYGLRIDRGAGIND